MRILVVLLFFILLFSGISFGIYELFKSRSLFFGYKTTLQSRIKKSIALGISASMIFMSVILGIGIIDQNYTWTPNKIVSSALIALIPGLITGLGSYWQFFVSKWFRKRIEK